MEIINVHDKTAINNFLDNKADKTTVQASLTAVDTELSSKMAIANAHTKAQTNAFLDAKADDVEFEFEKTLFYNALNAKLSSSAFDNALDAINVTFAGKLSSSILTPRSSP